MKKQSIIVVAIALMIVALFALPVATGIVGGNYSMADLERIQDEISEGSYDGIVSTWIDTEQMQLHADFDSRIPASYLSALKMYITYGGAVSINIAPITATPT